MKLKNLIFVGIISAILFTMTIQLHTVKAAPITLDLKKAKNPGPGFTDEKVGTVSIDSNVNKTAISSDVTAKAKPDKAFEGWLVDAGGSNYKLSLGKYDDKGHLQFSNNPFHWSWFLPHFPLAS